MSHSVLVTWRHFCPLSNSFAISSPFFFNVKALKLWGWRCQNLNILNFPLLKAKTDPPTERSLEIFFSLMKACMPGQRIQRSIPPSTSIFLSISAWGQRLEAAVTIFWPKRQTNEKARVTKQKDKGVMYIELLNQSGKATYRLLVIRDNKFSLSSIHFFLMCYHL